MEKIELFSNRVICAQSDADEHLDTYRAKFVISDFSVNHNGVAINRGKFDGWMRTLVNKPIVGKLVSTAKGTDFSGHNMKIVWKKDDNGNMYKDTEFDTSAFGTFTDVAIESIDGNECIVATCEIWKRFTNACKIIMDRVEQGVLNTSWEISVLESHMENIAGNMVKVIDNGIFTAHCLLGSSVAPAFDCSRLLEVAEATSDFDAELASAISKDFEVFDSNDKEEAELTIDNEVTITENEDSTVVSENTDVVSENDKEKPDEKTEPEGNDDSEEPEKNEEEDSECKKKEKSEVDDSEDGKTETSSLTVRDLHIKLMDAISRSIGDDCFIEHLFPAENVVWVKEFGRDVPELEYIVFSYVVNGDEVAISEPEKKMLTVSVSSAENKIEELNAKIAEMADAIASANETITNKDNEISELSAFKERCEREDAEIAAAELAKKQNDLKDYALSSGLISESEICEGGEFEKLIAEVNESAIKTIIAERFMSKGNKKAKTEISAKVEPIVTKANLKNVSFAAEDAVNIVSAYLKRK